MVNHLNAAYFLWFRDKNVDSFVLIVLLVSVTLTHF